MRRHLIPILMVLIAIASYAGWRYYSSEKAREAAISSVIAHTASLETIEESIEALGTAKAFASATITATAADRVTAIHFEDGATVEEGAILVELEHAEEEARIATAQAILSEQQREYGRISELAKRQVAPTSQRDLRQSQLEQAEAALKQAQAQRDDRIIRAPFTGRLGIRQISVGTLVEPGDTITTLDASDRIQLDFALPERFLASAEPGGTIQARSPAFPDKIFLGKVTALDGRIDPVTRAITIRAEIDNADGLLRSGMLLSVQMQLPPRQSITIPEEALTTEGTRHYVLTIKDPDTQPTAEKREVTLGLRMKGKIEILSGLSAGEQIIADGMMARPKQPVRILPQIKREDLNSQPAE